METSLRKIESQIPPALIPVLDDLKQESRTDGRSPSEEKALTALHEALNNVSLLNDSWDDLSNAARLLEKIQISVTETERIAFISHSHRAAKSFRLARYVANFSRELFHEMKRKGPKKKAA